MASDEQNHHCSDCQSIKRQIKEMYEDVEKNILYMHTKYEVFRMGQKRNPNEVKTFMDDFLKNVCSLRNTKGGVLVIHTTDLTSSKPYLGDFDGKVDEKLAWMIEDDSLFVDNFEKRFWLDSTEPFIILVIEGSSTVSTADFSTKMPLDVGTFKPRARELAKFIFSPQKTMHNHQTRKKVNWNFEENKQCFLFEARDIQLKRFKESDQGNEELDCYIWKHLRDYITAFTKQSEGGSFYFGIEEEKDRGGKCTGCTTVNGIELDQEECTNLETKIKKQIKENTYWCRPNEQVPGDVIEDNIAIYFHPVIRNPSEGRKTKYVLEVAVLKQFDGVVFSNKDGPISYKIDRSCAPPSIKLVPFPDWLNCLQEATRCDFCRLNKTSS